MKDRAMLESNPSSIWGFAREWCLTALLFSVSHENLGISGTTLLVKQNAINSGGTGAEPPLYGCLLYAPVIKAMPFPHRSLPVDGYDVGIVDNPVHNRIGYRAVLIRNCIDPPVPSTGLILCAEYG